MSICQTYFFGSLTCPNLIVGLYIVFDKTSKCTLLLMVLDGTSVRISRILLNVINKWRFVLRNPYYLLVVVPCLIKHQCTLIHVE